MLSVQDCITVSEALTACCHVTSQGSAERVCAIGQAVRAIGRCAVTLERAAERCINVLLDLIKQKVNYVVQEAVVVITDIFRRYPNRCYSDKVTLLWLEELMLPKTNVPSCSREGWTLMCPGHVVHVP